MVVIALIVGGSVAGVSVARGEIVTSQEGKAVQFNPAFFPGGAAMKIDLARFSRGNPVMPGAYSADVWLNGVWQARRSVRFAVIGASSDAMPCISPADLATFGVSLVSAPGPDDESCHPLTDFVPDATTRFDVSEQRLDIEVPQASLTRSRSGLVAPSDRDPGIASGQLGWRLNLHRSSNGRQSRMARYLAHEGGLNAGGWRMREAGSWSRSRYKRRHLYVERQVEAWRSQWRIGDMTLADGSFAPVRLRGMTLASDLRMRDDASIGYKPKVRGVARTHALVRVSQGGILISELSVPPGAFVIDDLHGLGRGGDLEVTVDEEDGGRTSFRVPFFAMPELMGEGVAEAALSVGRVAVAQGRGASLLQATWRRGLAGDTTLYTGLRHGDGTASLLLGGAVDTLAGAFAVDLTDSRLAGRSHAGSAGRPRTWRLRHGRRWGDRTSLWASLVHERGREDRMDLMVQRDMSSSDGGILTATISQRRGRSPFRSRQPESARSVAVAWSRGWRRSTLDISLRHAVDETSAHFALSVPFATASAPTVSLALHAARNDESRLQVGVAGAVGPESELGYGAFLGRGARGDRRVGLSASHLSGAGESSVAIDHSGTAHGESFSTSGALVIHDRGITRAQRLGDAMALVHAAGAAGARLASATGARLDRRGYGVVPHLSPFRWNTVEIDPTGLSLDVSLPSTRRRVAPTAGALVLVPFDTDVGRTSLLTVHRVDGSSPAFGAEVLDEQGRSVGVVGQAGKMFVRDVTPGSPLTIRWGERAQDRCIVRTERSGQAARDLDRLTGVCQ